MQQRSGRQYGDDAELKLLLNQLQESMLRNTLAGSHKRIMCAETPLH